MSACPDHHVAKKFYNDNRTANTLSLVLSDHAERELAKDDMDVQDCMNILRGGVWEPPEWENGSWRYRVSTQKMTVVIAIDSDRVEFTIVTAWRNK